MGAMEINLRGTKIKGVTIYKSAAGLDLRGLYSVGFSLQQAIPDKIARM